MVFRRSGSCKSSEAYWMVIHRSGSCKSGESYREGFVPAKVEVDRLFYQNSLFTGGIMKQNRLSLYTVNMKLIRNYHNQGDNRVFSVSPQTGKDTRPFVGIVVICDDKQYCIPLSSPKEKHKSMKNSIDFHKIIDGSGKLIGVLDFNNMIPVRNDVLQKINVKILPHDSSETRHYKNLVIDQITFCQQNQNIIVNKANKLYLMVKKKNVSSLLKRRCLDWDKLEKILARF